VDPEIGELAGDYLWGGFSTLHMQDMYDQAGDSLRDRRTLPLVVGDSSARWMTIVPMLF
jgi:hypothetical protein